MKAAAFLIILAMLSGCVAMATPTPTQPPACTATSETPPIALGFNEHYAHQQRDGSMFYFVQDRQYRGCMVTSSNQRDNLTKEQWEATMNDYRYEEVSSGN